MKRRLPLLILSLSLALTAQTLPAAGFSGITPRFGVIYEVAPSLKDANGYFIGGPPLLTYFLGIGAPLELGGLFSWEPALDLYYYSYLWSPDYSRALATDNMMRTSFTLAFLIQSPLVLDLPLGPDWKIGLGLGPAFNLRASLLATLSSQDLPSANADIPKIAAYFYDQGRWFFPETFLRINYRLTDKVDFAFSAIAFWPLFNLWIKPTLPLDEGIFGGELRVKAKFP